MKRILYGSLLGAPIGGVTGYVSASRSGKKNKKKSVLLGSLGGAALGGLLGAHKMKAAAEQESIKNPLKNFTKEQIDKLKDIASRMKKREEMY